MALLFPFSSDHKDHYQLAPGSSFLTVIHGMPTRIRQVVRLARRALSNEYESGFMMPRQILDREVHLHLGAFTTQSLGFDYAVADLKLE